MPLSNYPFMHKRFVSYGAQFSTQNFPDNFSVPKANQYSPLIACSLLLLFPLISYHFFSRLAIK